MPAIIFPSGHRYAADTWADLERQLRANGWNPESERKFRKEYRNRARVWSGTEIALESSSREFFEDLERAGLVMIERTDP